MKIFSFILLLITSQSYLFCQSPSEDFIGTWYTYSSNHRFTEHFSVSPYAEFRFYEPSSNYNLVFLSLRANYHLQANQNLGMGYAFLDIDTVFEFDYTPNVQEHRLLEQYVVKKSLRAFKLQHRFRVEHRILDFGNRNEIQNRFRYRLSFKYDINKTIFLVLSEEPFVNFQDQVFHENRFYAGIDFKVLKNSQLQIGYLKQHVRKNNLNRIQIGIRIQTDSRKPRIFSLVGL